MAAKKPLVHFTHHVCLAANPEAMWREHLYQLGLAVSDGPYGRDTDEKWFFGSKTRHIENEGVLMSCRQHRQVTFTTDARAVTCAQCCAGLARHTRKTWLAYHNARDEQGIRMFDHAPRVRRRLPGSLTWNLRDEHGSFAGRHQRCPDPRGVDGPHTVRRFEAAIAVKRLRAGTALMQGALCFGDAESMRRGVERVVTETAPHVVAMLKPAIDEWTMIGDVLAEVDKMRQRAGAVVYDVVQRICDGLDLVQPAQEAA